MDNNAIEVFLTVTETGSFRKAAETLGYTQAGVSYIIKSIEEDTGLNLFIRDRKGVRLSPEGEALLPEIKPIDNDRRHLMEKISDLKGLESGTIRVQIFDSMSIHWLPGILKKFKDDFPNITVELISEENTAKAEEMVMTGEVDCGFFLARVSSPIDVFPLKEESLLAVISTDHELADADTFPVSRLSDYPYISMRYESTNGIDDIFARFNAVKNTAYYLDNDYAAMAMASSGLGFCIFPELLLIDAPYEICCLPFDKPQSRTISIGTRSMDSASKACRKFIEYAIEWVNENAK